MFYLTIVTRYNKEFLLLTNDRYCFRYYKFVNKYSLEEYQTTLRDAVILYQNKEEIDGKIGVIIDIAEYRNVSGQYKVKDFVTG